MSVSRAWLRRPSNVTKVLELYRCELRDLTTAEIAKELGTTQDNVRGAILQNIPEAERKALQARRYAATKRGKLNPMYGKTGAQHHNHKGDCEDGYGYLTRIVDGKRYFSHRVVMAEALGLRVKDLPSSMVIHHIDGDTMNNHLDNLALMTSSGHATLEQIQKRDARMAATGESALDRARRLGYERNRRSRQL